MSRSRLVLGWALVGIPLLYGITQTALKVTALFV
ncbi:MFS transporter small subunit [Kocuria sp. KH4]